MRSYNSGVSTSRSISGSHRLRIKFFPRGRAVVGRNNKTIFTIAKNVMQAADIAGYHRQTQSKRLQHRVRHALGIRAQETEDAALLITLHFGFAFDESGENDIEPLFF